MVRHIVMWNLKDENKEAAAAEIKAALEALCGQIEGLISLRVSRCYNGCDLCLCSDFESRKAVLYYRDHPLHKAAQKLVHVAMTERYSCDYEY